MNDLEVIERELGLEGADAELVLSLCEWVEHEIAIERFGYPKDNILPAPMNERLADPEYVHKLLRAALDEDAPDRVIEALQNAEPCA